MKALLLEDRMRLAYVERPVPEPAEDEVLVAVRACGICGSDVHGIDGSTGRRVPPLVMGHEAAGVVALAGAGASGWREGDRVTFDSTVYCGECAFCSEGRSNLCERRSVFGAATAEFRRDGAFADYVAVPGRVLTRLPDAVSFEQAAFVEPLSVALHAVARAQVEPDVTAVVVGTGVIGLLVLQVLRAAGARRLIGIDLDPGRLHVARSLGADPVLRPDAGDLADAVGRLTDGRGADVSIEAVGTTSAVGTALAVLRRGGRVVLIGNLSPSIELPLQAVITGELTLAGSCGSSGEYAAALDLLALGAVDLRPLISA